MISIFSQVVVLAILSSLAQCATQEIDGEWYSDPVDALTYIGWGTPGSYQRVTDMSNGICRFGQNVTYGGGIAPLDKEVSWHFRGPLQLKQFAHYTLSEQSSQMTRGMDRHRRQPGHNNAHENRQISQPQYISFTMNGQLVSYRNPYWSSSTTTSLSSQTQEPATATSSAVWVTAWSDARALFSWRTVYTKAATLTPSPSVMSSISSTYVTLSSATSTTYQTSTSTTTINNPSTATSDSRPISQTWQRQAYYNAEQGAVDGLVFLNNQGASGISGTWDMSFGNSLSYTSTDGQTSSQYPQVLADVIVPDGSEVILFSDSPCNDQDPCPYSRPDTVAYHGFAGDSKMFLIEFSMPMSGNDNSQYDMPAAWILNAEIARTEEFGDCSCWHTGCGELDVFETLHSGSLLMKSTLHAGVSGGSNDYFVRPARNTTEAAIILDGRTSRSYIIMLPSNVSFDEQFSDTVVQGFRSPDGAELGSNSVALK